MSDQTTRRTRKGVTKRAVSVPRVKCSICGLIYTPGQRAVCKGDKANLGLLTKEALRFAKCADANQRKGPTT